MRARRRRTMRIVMAEPSPLETSAKPVVFDTADTLAGSPLGMNPTSLFVGLLLTSVTAHFDTVDTFDAMNLSVRKDSQEPLPYFRRVLVIVELLQRDIKYKFHLTSL
jgi:hypothetical protein